MATPTVPQSLQGRGALLTEPPAICPQGTLRDHSGMSGQPQWGPQVPCRLLGCSPQLLTEFSRQGPSGFVNGWADKAAKHML